MKSREKKEQGGSKRPEEQGLEVKAVTSRKRKGKEVKRSERQLKIVKAVKSSEK